MTNAQIHERLRFFLDRQDSGVLPSMYEEHLDLFYSEARRKYIEAIYSDDSVLYRGAFERAQKDIDILSEIVETVEKNLTAVAEEELTSSVSLSNLQVNKEYRYFVRGRVQTKLTDKDAKYARVKIVRQDELEVARIDPFNASHISEPIIYFEKNEIRVIRGTNFTTPKIRITYLWIPKDIDSLAGTPITCPLKEETQKSIIQLGVQNALELFESVRQKTNKENIQE